MKRLINGFLLIGFLHLAYGVFVSFWRPSLFPEILTPPANNKFYDYAGAINIRTIKSNGSGDYETVLAAAEKAKLNFVILTDFNDFSPDRSSERYYDNVLVLVGGEYGYLDSRIFNFDFQKTDHLQGPGRSQMIFADLLSRHNPNRPEGLLVLAHPLKPGYQLDTYPPGLNGIELMNLKSVWQDTWLHSKASFIWTAFVYPFNSNLAFLRMIADAGEREISLWDKLNQKHPTHGYFGSAAEAKFKLTGDTHIKFPSYETIFSIVQNHILIRSELTGNPIQDRKKISEALRHGQFYMGLDILQSSSGFEAYISDGEDLILPIGSESKYREGLELAITLPAKPHLPFETVVYRDGEKIMTSTSATTTYTLPGPGVYRAVVRVKVPLPLPDGHKWINWILTNPFYIK